ncbi:pentatricopeptide repeat-containing protein [Hordeum vulgare]|nr:pentatricopeptide repeat-containing protein [Hordeum vulgare]
MPATVHLAPLPHRAQPHASKPPPPPAQPVALSLPQWNALLADHSRAGRHADALALLAASEGIAPDRFTLPPAARSCGFLRVGAAAAGRQVHALAAKLGLPGDPFVGNSLVSMYGRCGRVEDAEKVFGGIPDAARNIVSWNALMAALSGDPRRGLELFRDCLVAVGGMVDEATLVTVLPMCAALGWSETGRAVHGLAAKSGWDAPARVGNALVDMYAKCGELADAERAFPEAPSVVSWNVMLGAYTRNREAGAAFGLLRDMQIKEHGSVPADEITVLSVLPACSGPTELSRLRELHAFTVRRGLDAASDKVPNALVAAYGRCGRLLHADRVFTDIRRKTVSSWNTLISAHAQQNTAAAIELFIQMTNACGLKPDGFSIGSLLMACADPKHLLHVKATHGFILRNGLERDIVIRASLLSAYIRCSRTEHLARVLFDAMEEKGEVLWIAMISGYSQNGLPGESLQLFREMQSVEGHCSSVISATSALMACSELSSVRLGKEMHCFALKADLCDDPFLSSSLIDMYSKCGFVEDARTFFDRLKARDAKVSWTAMITGYAVNGLGREAVELYGKMRREGMEPDEFTYLGLLMACGHAGMLEEGLRFFDEMRNHHHKIEVKLEHYSCVIGMLSRAGRFTDAVALMAEMPQEPDAKILSSVLSACHIHGEAELGSDVAERLLELEPDKAEHYVLASNMYAGSRRWDDMRKVRKMLRDAGIAKEPGCSWIDVAGKVYSFVAGENPHPEMEQVRGMWRSLEERIREIGYVPDTTVVLHELEEEEKVEALRWHSEKQAVTFGLLRTATPATVRVFKNIRMCKDCHNAARLISKVTGRDIVVRDKKRFHHFRGGICSCGDYW